MLPVKQLADGSLIYLCISIVFKRYIAKIRIEQFVSRDKLRRSRFGKTITRGRAARLAAEITLRGSYLAEKLRHAPITSVQTACRISRYKNSKSFRAHNTCVCNKTDDIALPFEFLRGGEAVLKKNLEHVLLAFSFSGELTSR